MLCDVNVVDVVVVAVVAVVGAARAVFCKCRSLIVC